MIPHLNSSLPPVRERTPKAASSTRTKLRNFTARVEPKEVTASPTCRDHWGQSHIFFEEIWGKSGENSGEIWGNLGKSHEKWPVSFAKG